MLSCAQHSAHLGKNLLLFVFERMVIRGVDLINFVHGLSFLHAKRLITL